MRRVILSIVFILSCSFIHAMFTSSDNDEIPTKDKIALKIINKTASTIEKKYQFHPIGIAMGGIGQFRYLGIEFQVFKPLSKDQARNILFACVKEFLNNINSSEEIKPFLKNYPFTPENISFTLYIPNVNENFAL